MTDRNTMVRIPSDLVGKLDELAELMRARLGKDAPEITRTFVHHLALRQGIPLLAERVAGIGEGLVDP